MYVSEVYICIRRQLRTKLDAVYRSLSKLLTIFMTIDNAN